MHRSQLPALQAHATEFWKKYYELCGGASSLSHHDAHRGWFIDQVGPPNQTNCLRLEAKHQPFKQYHGQLYWERALLTMAERMSMRVAWQMYKKRIKSNNDEALALWLQAVVMLTQEVSPLSNFYGTLKAAAVSNLPEHTSDLCPNPCPIMYPTTHGT